MRRLLLPFLSFLPCASTVAQTPAGSGIPVVDSALVARQAYANAGRMMRASDLAGARAEIARAASAYPIQPVYTWVQASLAARANDTSGVKAALEAYARLGVGRDVAKEPAFRAIASAPALQPAIRAHLENLRPLANSSVRHRLSDSAFWPEGIDYDAAGDRFFIASVQFGTISEVDKTGRMRDVMPRRQPGIGAMLGVRYDAPRKVLWATTSAVEQSGTYVEADSAVASLLRIRVADGSIERRWDVPRTARHALGDLAIGPRGDVFFSDSRDPVLYWLPAGGDSLIAIRDPHFRSLQGIAVDPRGDALYVADYSHGLLRIELATRAVSWLGASASGGATVTGIDGLTWADGSLIGVQNGVAPAQIVRFDLDPARRSILRATVIDRNIPLADEPTIGTMAGRYFVYVANSQWEKYDPSGKQAPNVVLTPPLLLALPIGR